MSEHAAARPGSGRDTSMRFAITRIAESPLGPLTAVVDDVGRLVRLAFSSEKVPERDSASPVAEGASSAGSAAAADAAVARVAAELSEYFAGSRREFSLSLAPRGTAFQQRVWDELRRIPYGDTVSYRELAARVGNPAACRAVARANATNPIPIIIPCHRVIGADGSLTGYGGGLDKKRRLLELEGAQARRQPLETTTVP